MQIKTSLGWIMVLFYLLNPVYGGQSREYRIIGGISETGNHYSLSQLEALMEVKVIKSSYFDRALNFKDSRLHVISFSKLLDHYRPAKWADAALINCFDNYQGIVSLEDVRQHDLQLATRIEIGKQFERPDWLNPLMIIIPDHSRVPYQERFVAANIREIKFVSLDDYYAPLQSIVLAAPEVELGFRVFKNNCLFCHSLSGIGGDKGVDLLESYNFSRAIGQEQFWNDFSVFHGKDNAKKQNVEQFVSKGEVKEIGRFLKIVRSFD